MHPFTVALTGGIASGKSETARRFAALGASVIDADVVAREIVQPGMPALEEIAATFGEQILDASGSLERAEMRTLIFGDAEARRKLETILHPRVRAEILVRTDAAQGPYVLLVILFKVAFEKPLTEGITWRACFGTAMIIAMLVALVSTSGRPVGVKIGLFALAALLLAGAILIWPSASAAASAPAGATSQSATKPIGMGPAIAFKLSAQSANLVVLFSAIGLVSWLTMARVVRGQVLSLRGQPFIEACRAMGVQEGRIFLRHILPNLIGPITVYATLTVPSAILQESFLSFLGVGVNPPLATWGSLASEGVEKLSPLKFYWWLLVFPCTLLAVTLLSLNFLGDGLRDVFDPKKEAAKI